MPSKALPPIETPLQLLRLSYHSKEGAPILAHFAAKAPAAGWAFTVH